ncbi:MAG TPA: DHA2 family efflux MFS transporter permease subunit [Solirubrobacteraceae bacterium]|jgi:EmrB/QacA subfamily drug resistance transporter|nr:DHA2 family efflux MFS transporter permease subunit [Solirubrobacteraceae bacterium]
MNAPADRRWLALYILCLGTLMIVLDSTIVNVALPSIKRGLHFNQSDLAWVVNAYLLTFGGFLLLGGRLGDLFGPRRLFIGGLILFTCASVVCGLAQSQGMLVAARAVQGFGGALASAVSLSLTITLFTEPRERARAMGIFGFVASGGGTLGVLLGGILTQILSWHWIFWVNVPIGAIVVMLSRRLLPEIEGRSARLDVAGAVTVTGGSILATYAIVNGNTAGWGSLQTLGLLGGSLVVFALFVLIETRVAAPLMPLRLFKLSNLRTANLVAVLWAAAMFAWFFLSALYLQQVLGYDPLGVGLAFLPANLIMGALSIAVSARLVMRYGFRRPMAGGLLLATIGLLLFARAPTYGHYIVDVLPSMVLLGIGAGIAFNPMLLAAMGDVAPEENGLASGLVNTSFMMGGALGLAVLASIAAARTNALRHAGHSSAVALTGGYHVAFLAGGGFALAGALLGALVIREPQSAGAPQAASEPGPQPEGAAPHAARA